MHPITEPAERNARETMQGEWDAEGTLSVHLPLADAEAFLQDSGWQHGVGGWLSPNGYRVWHTAEALQIELVARVR